MSDTKELLERAWRQAPQPENVMNSLIRRRDRKRRNQRIATGVLAIVVTLVSLAALIRTFGTVERPADEPTPAPTPEGIFANVGGWIAYTDLPGRGGPNGIWAVDPMRPNDPEARIQLSERPGKPLAWSNDGSTLLIWRERRVRDQGQQGWQQFWTGLFVLNADGTETQLATNTWNVGMGPGARYIYPGGSFSPDGSEVVFATQGGGIYTVDAAGGTPRLLRSIRHPVVNPTFSPDGTKIAYFEFQDLPGHTLRVMNADGTGDRVLLDSQAVNCLRPVTTIRPMWSPDGTRIAFSCTRETGIQVVGADGSGLSTVIVNGKDPYWSPDWSRIAFEVPWRRDIPPTTRGPLEVPRLAIANADGTHVQVFQYPAVAGPWNPLLLSAPGKGNPTGSGLAAPWVYAIALVVLVGVLIGGLRARGNIAPKRDQSNDVAS
jgi:Tol biopolymer transport system component